MRSLLKAVVLSFVSFFLITGVANSMELLGAGATFPYPLYSKMFHEYAKEFGVRVNYQAIGSGGGIRQLMERTVDFGATDAFMTDEELKEMKGEVVHIPICLGAVVVSYNLPGNPTIKLTPSVLSDIFLGKIRSWNDKRIVSLNPGLSLPKMPIVVVHRSDGSGTTFVFSDYLSKVSEEWKRCVGAGKSLSWPTGLGGKGNPGVAGLIQQIPGSIGYVELVYAMSNNIPFALIQNSSGRFIKPTIESVTCAAKTKIPPDARISITNTPNPDGYPISSFTWIIAYEEQCYGGRTLERARALVKLLWWMVHDGQRYAPSLYYSPLPGEAVKVAERLIRSITYRGKPVLGK